MDRCVLCTRTYPDAYATTPSSNSDTDSDEEDSGDPKKECLDKPAVNGRSVQKRQGHQTGVTGYCSLCTKQANLLQSPDDTAKTWYNFLKPKFATTEREGGTPSQ